jgi:glyoxylase-like metal-dependent hydrolase (beta-lactamase superfamily II)
MHSAGLVAVTATVDLLFTGYVGDTVASTVSLVRADGLVAVVDPGMVPSPASIVGPLAELDLAPVDVTDVILSHHHPDHVLNAGLFPAARFHDHWATYQGDQWDSRPCEGFVLAEGVELIATPGHTSEDLSTVVDTGKGIVVLTHCWWHQGSGPDPLAEDHDALERSRSRILSIATHVVPGHGPMYRVGDSA